MPTFYFENRLGRQDGRLIAGCDEAGRGPLAGPVVAAAVVMPENFPKGLARRLNDSKKLTREEREDLYPEILQRCAAAIALADVAEIDTFNILRASLLAMSRAVESLSRAIPPAQHAKYLLLYEGNTLPLDAVLVDGNQLPALSCPAQALVGGDGRSLSIAAASILAKVARDNLMRELSKDFPHYGFENHVGYGTPEHLAALKKHGPCPHHRQSFAPVRLCGTVEAAA